MEMPTVDSKVVDSQNGVTYIVRAYRALTRAELLTAVGLYRRQNKKAPKRGSTVVIISLLGSER